MSTENEIDQTAPDAAGTDERMWPMGAVTRRTGIGEHTLRAWERRFGFPTPHRLESGHRRYSSAQVRQLLLISRALGCGHRAGDVVPLTVPEIEDLLRQTGVVEGVATVGGTDEVVAEVIEACRRFDRDALVAILRRDASVLGMAAFLRERVTPLLEEIGDEWSRGGIEIRHEHFFSEVLEDELRSMRVPLQVSAGGRPVVLASLPNENPRARTAGRRPRHHRCRASGPGPRAAPAVGRDRARGGGSGCRCGRRVDESVCIDGRNRARA